MTKLYSTIFALFILAGGAEAKPPKVLVDIAPLHSLVAQVMGELAEPQLLLDPSSDVHHLQMRPSQARAVANAELVFWVGPELEPWFQSSLNALNETAVSVVMGGGARHLWLDPDHAKQWLGVIATSLAELDPDNAETYAVNAGNAQTGLAALIEETAVVLAPVSTARYVVEHDAYGAFSARFGMRIMATLRDSEAAEPGAAHVSEIRDLLNSGQVACVFADAGHSDALVRAVANGSGVPMGELDAMGIGLKPGPELYAALIRQIARAFADCG